MNFQTIPSMTSNKSRRDSSNQFCSVVVDGKKYGPTNYQLSVWEYEGGCSFDCEDPLRRQKSFLAKTYDYFSKNLMSLF